MSNTFEIDTLEALLSDMESVTEVDFDDNSVEAALLAALQGETHDTVESDVVIEASPAQSEDTAPTVTAAKSPKAPKAPKLAKIKVEKAPKVPKTPAAPKVPHVVYGSDKVRRLQEGLGNNLDKFLTLNFDDARLTEDALKSRQDETLEIIEAMGIKVKNRATNFLEFVADKGSLNTISTTAMNVLARDGYINVGDKGNFHTNLVAKPYSAATARAMGNNTLNFMRQLQILVNDQKGFLVANPNSVLLSAAASKLQLTFGYTDSSVSSAPELVGKDFIDATVEPVATLNEQVDTNPSPYVKTPASPVYEEALL